VRWATITDADGHGIRVDGDPTFDLTARRWTTEELDAARHTTDLVAGEHVHLNIDLAQNGVGTAACGPGVLPAYQLHPAPAALEVTFRLV
jgi:beta-galactosidase